MSSLLDLHLDKVEDPTVVPGGEEYELRILDAKVAPSKSSDRDVIKVMLEVVDNPTAKPVFVNMAVPSKDDDERKTYSMSLQIKQFMQAFDIDLKNPGDPAEWKGKTAWAWLNIGENQNGDEQNEVGRWIQKK